MPIVLAELESRYGLPEGYLARTSQIESGGNPNARNKASGAAGAYQFMPSTAKQFNLKNPYDQDASALAASELAAKNRDYLRNSLGRDVTPEEIYLAHQQGMGGAEALLKNPDKRAVDVLAKLYKDGLKTASKAIKQNGGDLNMSARDFANLQMGKYSGKGQEPDLDALLLEVRNSNKPPQENQEPDLDALLNEVRAGKAPQKPNTLVDIGMGALQGLREAATAPFDLGAMVGTAAVNAFTGDKVEAPTVGRALDTVGLNYKPETIAGEYAKTISSFAPLGAVGAGSKVGNVIRQAVIPGAVSETLGQATKGTEAEPYARVIGGLFGGAVASRPVTQFVGKKSSEFAKQTGEDISSMGAGIKASAPEKITDISEKYRKDSSAAFNKMKSIGANINNNSMSRLAKNMSDAFMDAGLPNETLHRDTLDIARQFVDRVRQGAVSLEELDQFKRLFRAVIRKNISSNPEDAMRSQRIVDVINDFFNDANPADFTNKSAEAVNALREGITKYSQHKKIETINDILERSAGDANKLQNEMYRLSINDKKLKQFKPDEVAAIKAAGNMSSFQGLLKMLGKFGFDLGSPLTMGRAAMPVVSSVFGGPVGQSLSAIGTLAGVGQRMVTRGKVEKVLRKIDKNSFTSPKTGQTIPRITITPEKK